MPPELNHPDRYRKRPEQAVLEAYSHCEVPAGCGGVVYRWRDKSQGVVGVLMLWAAGPAEVYVDGVRTTGSRLLLTSGRHVLAMAIEGVKADAACLLANLSFAPSAAGRQVVAGPDPAEVPQVVSSADGAWVCTTQPPAEGWTGIGFEAGDWSPMVEAGEPEFEERSGEKYRVQKLVRDGALPIAAPLSAEKLWVRKPFMVVIDWKG